MAYYFYTIALTKIPLILGVCRATQIKNITYLHKFRYNQKISAILVG